MDLFLSSSDDDEPKAPPESKKIDPAARPTKTSWADEIIAGANKVANSSSSPPVPAGAPTGCAGDESTRLESDVDDAGGEDYESSSAAPTEEEEDDPRTSEPDNALAAHWAKSGAAPTAAAAADDDDDDEDVWVSDRECEAVIGTAATPPIDERKHIRRRPADHVDSQKNKKRNRTDDDASRKKKKRNRPSKEKKLPSYLQPIDQEPSTRCPSKPDFDNMEKAAAISDTQSKENETDLVLGTIDGQKFKVPTPVNKWLREYQREGVKFMFRKTIQDREGSLLNDDMGLGKTVQIAALLSAYFHKTSYENDDRAAARINSEKRRKCRTVLVVAPAALLPNWVEELNTWGYFNVLNLGAIDAKKRGEIINKSCGEIKENTCEIAICSYAFLVNNGGHLFEKMWGMLILDEIHKIANPNTKTRHAVIQFITRPRIGLTGTLMSNTLLSVWSILDFLNPGSLSESSTQFEEQYEKPILRGQKPAASPKEREIALKLAKDLFEKKAQVALRRTKNVQLAKQLPKKEQYIVICKLTEAQKYAYEKLLNSIEAKWLISSLDAKPKNKPPVPDEFDWFIPDESTKTGFPSIFFKVYHLLMDVSNHLELLKITHNDTEARGIQKKAVIKYLLPTPAERATCDVASRFYDLMNDYNRSDDYLRNLETQNKLCGKVDVMVQTMQEWQLGGHKVLVFSEYTRILDILQQLATSQGWATVRVDSKTSATERQKCVHKFNNESIENCGVFLGSTGAAGTGLNLTGASRVLIFAPSWNPAKDAQSEDRAFRLGQVSNVEVYRMFSEGTMEEIKYVRQRYKEMADSIQEGTKSKVDPIFTGVMKSAEHGEEFGAKNMLRYLPGGLLNHIRTKYCEFLQNADESGVCTDKQQQAQNKTYTLKEGANYRIETDVLSVLNEDTAVVDDDDIETDPNKWFESMPKMREGKKKKKINQETVLLEEMNLLDAVLGEEGDSGEEAVDAESHSSDEEAVYYSTESE